MGRARRADEHDRGTCGRRRGRDRLAFSAGECNCALPMLDLGHWRKAGQRRLRGRELSRAGREVHRRRIRMDRRGALLPLGGKQRSTHRRPLERSGRAARLSDADRRRRSGMGAGRLPLASADRSAQNLHCRLLRAARPLLGRSLLLLLSPRDRLGDARQPAAAGGSGHQPKQQRPLPLHELSR